MQIIDSERTFITQGNGFGMYSVCIKLFDSFIYESLKLYKMPLTIDLALEPSSRTTQHNTTPTALQSGATRSLFLFPNKSAGHEGIMQMGSEDV